MLESCGGIIYKNTSPFLMQLISSCYSWGLIYEQTCFVTLEHNLPMTMGFEG